jgi:hypothetical protein
MVWRDCNQTPAGTPLSDALSWTRITPSDDTGGSMLAWLSTGLILAAWPLLLPAPTVFVIGTGIRIRTEDTLLAEQFGEEFAAYKRGVPACIPWLR